MLSGLVDRRINRGWAGGGSTGDSRPECSVTGLNDRGSASELGLEEDPLWYDIMEERLLDAGLFNISKVGSAT
jgi:hypothetical protein